MGILSSIAGFLVGKPPKIFDKDGTVRHEHPKKKWEDWQARYTQSSDYNWRNHSGKKRGSLGKP
jgi:hypothetical protein